MASSGIEPVTAALIQIQSVATCAPKVINIVGRIGYLLPKSQHGSEYSTRDIECSISTGCPIVSSLSVVRRVVRCFV